MPGPKNLLPKDETQSGDLLRPGRNSNSRPVSETAAGPGALKPELAVIAPYQALALMAAEEAHKLGLEIAVEIGDLGDGAKAAGRLAEEGVQIFISRGGTARWIRDLGFPVVEIEVGPCDILETLRDYRNTGQAPPKKNGRAQTLRHERKGLLPLRASVGLIAFENVLAGAHRLAGLLDIDLEMRGIAHESEVSARLDEFQGQVDMVLGDMVVAGQAASRGIESRLIHSGPEAVAAALREASERLALWRQTTERNRRHLEVLSQFKTVMDALEDPVLILDQKGRVRTGNQAAAKIWGLQDDGDWANNKAFRLALRQGQPLTDQVSTVNGRPFLLDFRPIISEGEGRESPLLVVMGRSAEKVEKSERRLRKAVYLKGHTARFRFDDILTEDRSFKRLLHKSAEYARADSAILIQGESGTGKEMLAQSIHHLKFGGQAPFVALNCASLPASILESELFGYAPGAFTGALKEGKKGFFELAHGGTLFLDELGEMPLELQSRLLRAIEEKAVLPLGADRIVPVNVRLIAATNIDLAEAVSQGRFRKDLYFRLGVLILTIPPLRERGDDALVLFKAMALRVNPDLDPALLSGPALRALLSRHPWPGNAREVKNLVERLAITTSAFTKGLDELSELLPEELLTSRAMLPRPEPNPDYDRDLLKELLSPPKHSELARRLGISRTTLWRRRKKLENGN